jgi:hypothetical protein
LPADVSLCCSSGSLGAGRARPPFYFHTFGLSFHDVLALGDAVEDEPQGRPDHG